MTDSKAYFDRKASGMVIINGVQFKNQEEARATSLSTQINIHLKENPRTNYIGDPVKTKGVLSNKLSN